MKQTIIKYTKTIVVPLLLYSAVTFFLLHKTLLSEGIITGSDWAIPATSLQAENYFYSSFSTWTTLGGLAGGFKSFLTDIPVSTFFFALSKAGFSGAAISKIFLSVTYVMAGLGMYYHLRYQKLGYGMAFLGGLLYITAPFFFNFTVIGWIYALLGMALFPVYLTVLDKSVREKKLYLAVAAGLIFTLAMVQSTSLLWFSVGTGSLMLSYISDRVQIKNYINSLLCVGVVLVITNIFWLVNIFGDATVTGSSNVLSSVSTGTWSRLSVLNIIRGWGTLFNYSFESAFEKSLVAFSFVMPIVLAAYSYFVKEGLKIKKLTYLTLYLFPIVLFFLGQGVVSSIPFGNVFRDGGRISVTSTFSLVALSVLGLNYLKKNKYYGLFLVLLVCLLINMHPFLRGDIWKDQEYESDIRLRTYEYNKEYDKVEAYLAQDGKTSKALYFPITSSIEDFSDNDFRGTYKEMAYLYANMAPVPGSVYISDKEKDGINGFYRSLSDEIKWNFDKVEPTIFDMVNFKYLVFYKKSMVATDWEVYSKVQKSENFEDITTKILGADHDAIAVFKIKTPSQEITSPKSVYITNSSITKDIQMQTLIKKNGVALFHPTPPIKSTSGLDIVEAERIDDYKLLNYTKKATDIWGWPSVNNVPGTFKYRLVLTKERINEFKAEDGFDKVDALLWHALKRTQEIQKYQNTDHTQQFESFSNKYEQIKTELGTIPVTERKQPFYSSVNKVGFYLKELQNIQGFENYFKDYKVFVNGLNLITCEGICYEKNIDSKTTVPIFIDETEITTQQLVFAKDTIVLNHIEEILVTDEDYKASGTFIKDFGEKNNLFSYVNIAERIVSSDIFKNLYISLVGAKIVELPSLTKGKTYRVDFDYYTSATPIKIVFIEDLLIAKEDFDVKNGKNNFSYQPVVTSMTSISPEDLDSRDAEKLAHFTARFEPTAMSKRTYLFISDGINKTNASEQKILNFKVTKEDNGRLFLAKKEPEKAVTQQTIKFDKQSRTRYIGRIEKPSGNFAIILKQRFHPGWELKLLNKVPGRKSVTPKHYAANGYANGWIVDSSSFTKNEPLNFVIEFKPQRKTEVLMVISGLFIVAFIYIVLKGIYLDSKKPSTK